MRVYVIQVGEDGPVKIGRSAMPLIRLATLQAAHHETLHLRRTVDGEGAIEQWFHKRFINDRIRGEWFAFNPDMLTVMPPSASEAAPAPAKMSKLDEWLSANNERRSAFAARLGTSAGYVSDLCQSKVWPSMKMAQRIMVATRGDVRPEDFFEDAA